jgi:hypothetical protein
MRSACGPMPRTRGSTGTNHHGTRGPPRPNGKKRPGAPTAAPIPGGTNGTRIATRPRTGARWERVHTTSCACAPVNGRKSWEETGRQHKRGRAASAAGPSSGPGAGTAFILMIPGMDGKTSAISRGTSYEGGTLGACAAGRKSHTRSAFSAAVLTGMALLATPAAASASSCGSRKRYGGSTAAIEQPGHRNVRARAPRAAAAPASFPPRGWPRGGPPRRPGGPHS